eukprot:jgi/Chlat1/4645/Chrsp3S05636
MHKLLEHSKQRTVEPAAAQISLCTAHTLPTLSTARNAVHTNPTAASATAHSGFAAGSSSTGKLPDSLHAAAGAAEKSEEERGRAESNEEKQGRSAAAAWLAAAGLPQYAAAFIAAGYDDQDTLSALSTADLIQIEAFTKTLILPGHKRRLVQLAQKLASSSSSSISGGGGVVVVGEGVGREVVVVRDVVAGAGTGREDRKRAAGGGVGSAAESPSAKVRVVTPLKVLEYQSNHDEDPNVNSHHCFARRSVTNNPLFTPSPKFREERFSIETATTSNEGEIEYHDDNNTSLSRYNTASSSDIRAELESDEGEGQSTAYSPTHSTNAKTLTLTRTLSRARSPVNAEAQSRSVNGGAVEAEASTSGARAQVGLLRARTWDGNKSERMEALQDLDARLRRHNALSVQSLDRGPAKDALRMEVHKLKQQLSVLQQSHRQYHCSYLSCLLTSVLPSCLALIVAIAYHHIGRAPAGCKSRGDN